MLMPASQVRRPKCLARGLVFLTTIGFNPCFDRLFQAQRVRADAEEDAEVADREELREAAARVADARTAHVAAAAALVAAEAEAKAEAEAAEAAIAAGEARLGGGENHRHKKTWWSEYEFPCAVFNFLRHRAKHVVELEPSTRCSEN